MFVIFQKNILLIIKYIYMRNELLYIRDKIFDIYTLVH